MAYIENEGAYERAKQARIAQNRRIGGRRRWFEREGAEECQLLNDWLFGCGEYDLVRHVDADAGCFVQHDEYHGGDYIIHSDDGCKCSAKPHPMSFYARGDFYDSMRGAIDEWGGLSEGQHAAVKRGYEKAVKRLAEREAQREAQHEADLEKGWVGELKERRDFDVVIEKRFDFESQFGYVHLHVMRDADGNIIVYKGSVALGKKGDEVKFKASVKAHEVRDGVKQSIVARPKLLD